MKKNIIKITSAVALVAALSTSVTAEETQFGAGVSVSGNTTTVRGTISLDDGLRLEPYFSFTYVDRKNDNSTSNLQVGSALHMLKAIKSDINAYYGGFVGIGNTDSGAGSTTTFNLGPVAGVEYALDKQFTLGAEVRMNFGFGDDTVIGTDSAVLVRYYF